MPRATRVLVLLAALVLTLLAAPAGASAAAAPDHRRRTPADAQPESAERYTVPVLRRVTYSVMTRGAITASLEVFRRQAQETYDDPRGWRAGGVQFRRVRRGGDFTLVLAAARAVPSFSPTCATTATSS
jgi:hypothetical protein